MNEIILILIIILLGPVIGSIIGVIRKPSQLFMMNMLAFAAGIMLAISFLELIPESIRLSSLVLCCIGIIVGSLFMYMLDKLIPHLHPGLCKQEQGCNLERTAVYLLFGIFLHNFPEGMAMATGIITGFSTTLMITIAIAVHNIPEAICTSAPYYYCSGKRLKSFLVSTSTAIPLILGFLVARYLFQNIPVYIVGTMIAATAGVMIYITVDELIPVSCSKHNGWSHASIFSFIIGVLFVILLSSL